MSRIRPAALIDQGLRMAVLRSAHPEIDVPGVTPSVIRETAKMKRRLEKRWQRPETKVGDIIAVDGAKYEVLSMDSSGRVLSKRRVR